MRTSTWSSTQEKGDLEIWRNREIVKNGTVEDENEQIALSDALKIEDDFEVGEDVSEEIKLESFGRRSVFSVRTLSVELWRLKRTRFTRSIRCV